MAQTKYEFFKSRIDDGRAVVIINLIRPGASVIKKMSTDQKYELKEMMERARKSFYIFKDEIDNALKP